jgi:hypothetical protein
MMSLMVLLMLLKLRRAPWRDRMYRRVHPYRALL